MKQNYEQLSNLISLNRSFFEDALLPEINAGLLGVSNLDVRGASLGVFATNPAQINFVQVQSNKTKGIFKDDEEKSDIIDLNPVFSEFIKAYCVSLFRNRTVSGSVVRNTVKLHPKLIHFTP
ncbi:hypothetical protein V4D09_15465 [Vibrio mimicus]|uniref:hypothetical protein n=1 Tax=Vibrio mimicus TaxID=674 RepID=UPI002F94043A